MRPPCCLEGPRVRLVPYAPEHVPKYHEWMTDPELLELTASEPLSLEEEVKLQREWAEDPHKTTFILLDRTDGDRMVGDVNLFWHEPAESDGGLVRGTSGLLLPAFPEIEIMVAEPAARRKGLAREALGLIMLLARRHYGALGFVAKILERNAASLRLFADVLGFVEERRVAIFHEVHLRLVWDEIAEQRILGLVPGFDLSAVP
eukprot:TRINITY_DN16360_c0_g1_i1.p1 TRINITY_DN16360_c0_g1~~TRINITY_DN16360_c0_g1_i1.p1  ORF type:complete len:217 (-),score=42.12 TRINITY_DN16360_c0_g1_i1:104-715(-)